MLAKRPSLEEALPKYRMQAAAIESVQQDFENGKYQYFLESLHQRFLRARSSKRYNNLFKASSINPSLLSYLGQSMIDTFANYPSKLNAVRSSRSQTLTNLQKEYPHTYLNEVLAFLSNNVLTPELLESLAMIRNAELFHEIHRKFCISLYLYNTHVLRSEKQSFEQVPLYCLALDFERLRHLEGASDADLQPHIVKVRNAICDLAKLSHWEVFLRNVAADCFKLPCEVDEKLAQIQKDYMQQRAECIRKNRELLTFQ